MIPLTKRISLFLALLLLLFSFASCSESPKETESGKPKLRLLALNGPTGIGFSSLFGEDAKGNTQIDYDFSFYNAPDELAAAVIRGDFDIACLPVNLAPTLYKKTGGELRMLAVNTLGVLYLIDNGNGVSSAADLKGKTVWNTGKGATPEFILNAVLSAYGLEAGRDVTVEYTASGAELASACIADLRSLAVLPEPNVTSVLMQNPSFSRVIDLAAAYREKTGNEIIQGVTVVSKKFAEAHPEEVSLFLEEAEKSVEAVLSDPAAASLFAESAGILPKAAIAEKAIPNCNIVCRYGKEANEETLSMLKILLDSDPALIGGALPDDDFFYFR